MYKGIGIDPGLSGAVAAVWENGARYEVWDMPVVKAGSKKEYDIGKLVEILRKCGYMGVGGNGGVEGFGGGQVSLPCYVEKVGAMPKQGLSSTFKFGMGYGIAQACAISAGHRMTLIRPQSWKKIMLRDMKKDKGASCARAVQLFPSAELTGPRGGAKDGRCEALLLAELARLENFGGGMRLGVDAVVG
jgi:crossover junction endodeoxyribonuclease RuvC